MRDEHSAIGTPKQVWRYLPWAATISCVVAIFTLQPALPARQAAFSGPTSSQPLALSADGDVLAVANPDNNSVTFFDTSRATPRLIDEVTVGRERTASRSLPMAVKRTWRTLSTARSRS